ncbi:MAG TPA: hypothetical protein VHM91_14960 [Verrucomicrobiales bacterium]|jgi:tetratricopeptide (TPR) repeat protein|nr:hypothetical protein [Verrucomicrobiales bacterium]
MPVSRRYAAAAQLIGFLCLAFTGALRAHGDLGGRIGDLKAEILQHPGDGARRLTLADLLFQDGNFEGALTALADLDRMEPGKFPTDKLRGSALLALQRPAGAREALDRFLTRYPGDVPALLFRARALSALSETDAALNDYRAALRLSAAPEPDLFQEAAAALASARHPDEALAVLDRGIQSLGLIPSLAQRALDVELSLKRYDAALARVETMQHAAPRPEQWMAKRAAILTTACRIPESREAWQSLLTHLAGLPAAERSSNAMCRLAEEARQGLAILRGVSLPERASATPSLSSPQRILPSTKS